MFSKDYLVICGRDFTRSIGPASRCSERTRNSSKLHHRSTLRPYATPLQGEAIGIFCSQIRGSERNGLMTSVKAYFGIPLIQSESWNLEFAC
jgi:hypothetical protein